jgi:large-conductance mechanosensitive channel
MILVRFILISVAVYLIIRSFMKFGKEDGPEHHKEKPENKGKSGSKKISKSIGEYVDYEEIRKKDF